MSTRQYRLSPTIIDVRIKEMAIWNLNDAWMHIAYVQWWQDIAQRQVLNDTGIH